MEGGSPDHGAWLAPRVVDHGTLAAICADGGVLAHVGVASLAAASTPVTPGTAPAGGVAGVTSSGGNTPTGGVAGSGGAAGPSGILGAGGSGGGGAGGGAGKLPFTGFPAAVVAGLGAGLTAAGVKLRAALRNQASGD